MDIVKAFNSNDLHSEIVIKGTIDGKIVSKIKLITATLTNNFVNVGGD
jgi:hypothetical protein